MASIDDAFEALAQLDENGRHALGICALQLREQLALSRARTAKSEWLLSRLTKWASDWGLSFDLSKAAAHWDSLHPQEPALATPWLAEHVAAQAEELSQLRVQLARAAASENAAVKRAEAADAQLQEFFVETEG